MKLHDLKKRNRASLEDTLNPEQKHLLHIYTLCCEEYNYFMKVSAFRKGFSIATKLLQEALADEK